MIRRSSPTDVDLSWHSWSQVVWLIAQGVTFARCWRIALVVGTILSVGNQATNIADDPGNWVTWVRVGFNYLVPFVVASIGYLTAFRAASPVGAD